MRGFKKLIDGLKEKDEYEVKYHGCCCWRGNVLGTKIKKKGEERWTTVMSLIYESLEVDNLYNVVKLNAGEVGNMVNLVKLKGNIDYDSLQYQTGIYGYLYKGKLKELNDEIKNLKSGNKCSNLIIK